MHSIKLILSLAVMMLSFHAQAQSDSLKSVLQKLTDNKTLSGDSSANPQLNETGRVNVIADSSIVQLERNTRGFREIRGYRIQILLGSIESIKTERNKFLSLNLPYSAYLKQVVPEYSLQVGDFTTRLDVEKHLQIIREYYPKAFVVMDIIEPPKYSLKK